jgi:hypothetical protein
VADDVERWLVEVAVDGPGEAVSAVRPPGRLDGRPLGWPGAATRYGAHRAGWPV